MPLLNIKTNVKTLPKDIHTKIVDLMVDIFPTNREYMCSSIEIGTEMCFGGTNAPCAIIDALCIGYIDPKSNIESSKKIMTLINKEFGIADDRMYIAFHPGDADFIGWKSSTTSEVLKK